jgi:mRNA-degrading endonuclease RelE of RelBE toxin-antitoxin system
MMDLTYEESPEFQKEFKRLKKRFRSLADDFITMRKNAIELLHIRKIDNRSCFPISGCVTESCSVFKVKKFACKSLRGGANSGLRAIYLYFEESKKVFFIEIYFKGDKENEDRERIKNYLSAERK